MRYLFLLLGVAVTALASVAPAAAQPARDLTPVHRLFSPLNSDHLYSADPNEMDTVQTMGYNYEGPAFFVGPRPGPGLVPLYRFNFPDGTHILTPSRQQGFRMGGDEDGILGYVSARPRRGLEALHDWYNPDMDRHLYTIDIRGEGSPGERWQDLGTMGYVARVGVR